MTEFKFHASKELTSQMEGLRREGFTGGESYSKDEFDTQSIHLCIFADNAIAAMVRLTQQPPSVLSAWSKSPDAIVKGDDVVEATRAVVDQQYRRLGLFKLLLAHVPVYLDAVSNSQRTTAAIELDAPSWPFLQSLGFEEVGISDFVDPPVMTGRRGRCILQRHRQCIVQARSVIKTVVSELENKSHSFSVDDSFHDQLLD